MSSSNIPQVRKPYQQPAGDSSSSAERKVKASECGLIENADGSMREVADNKKIFRLRVVTTGGPNGTSYHFRLTFCGYVWWSPAFWTRKRKSECFVLKPKAPTPEK
jgi:hypothetical protein